MGSQVFRVDASRTAFDYDRAFSRNIGWITEWEQQELRNKTVAIAGLGGVGGAHALTLARLGVGGFHIADFDRFDLVNFNRQSGAFISTLNIEKTAVTSQMVHDINPESRIKVFDHGVNESNLDSFLSGVDLFVDGFDFFVMDIRRKAYKRCVELGIPAIVAAPIGFGTTYIIFRPGGMSFEEYFRMEGHSEERQFVNFALGFTPKGFHRSYLVDASRLDLKEHRGPSTAASIQLCAGVVGAEAVKLLLGRGKVHAAPAYHQFDPFSGKWKRGRLRFGNAGPLQFLKRHIAYALSRRLSRNARPADALKTGSELEQILDLARWAPSGDNCQPWRFEIAGNDKIKVRILVEGETNNIYDYANGQPTLLAAGFLLETMRIAASRFGRSVRWAYLGKEDAGNGRTQHLIEVELPRDRALAEDPLLPYLTIRSVDRRPYRMHRMTREQKAELESVLGDELRIEWRESLRERLSFSRLSATATDIRLRLRETYDVHRRILDMNRRFSPDGIPAVAIGFDPLTQRAVRWMMQEWRRLDFANRVLWATAIPRIELDLVPGISCAAWFVMFRKRPVAPGDEIRSLLRAGERLQRFWLTATRLGLAMQPELAPLCFIHYGKSGSPISASSRFSKLKKRAAGCMPEISEVVFLGRIGAPKRTAPVGRSIRRSLTELLVD